MIIIRDGVDFIILPVLFCLRNRYYRSHHFSIAVKTDIYQTLHQQNIGTVTYLGNLYHRIFCILWAAFEQAGASFTYFAEEQTRKTYSTIKLDCLYIILSGTMLSFHHCFYSCVCVFMIKS